MYSYNIWKSLSGIYQSWCTHSTLMSFAKSASNNLASNSNHHNLIKYQLYIPHGTIFYNITGQCVNCKFMTASKYHQKFPHSQHATALLTPSNTLKLSLQGGGSGNANIYPSLDALRWADNASNLRKMWHIVYYCTCTKLRLGTFSSIRTLFYALIMLHL